MLSFQWHNDSRFFSAHLQSLQTVVAGTSFSLPQPVLLMRDVARKCLMLCIKSTQHSSMYPAAAMAYNKLSKAVAAWLKPGIY